MKRLLVSVVCFFILIFSGLALGNLVDAESSLLGSWPLHEGKGSVAQDISGNVPTHNGTISMGSGYWTTDNNQNYLFFNGADTTGTYVGIANNFNFTDKITVEAYIKLQDKGYPADEWQKSNHAIVAQSNSFELVVTGGDRLSLNLWTSQGAKQMTVWGYSLFGAWHKVAFTYDGANIILYIDDEYKVRAEHTGTLVNNATTYIGTRGAGCMFAKGIISDVKIYDHVAIGYAKSAFEKVVPSAVYPSFPVAFDFGSSASPLKSGFTRVTESTLYAAGSYGFTSITGLSSISRTVNDWGPDDLCCDFVRGTNSNEFKVDLANGDYIIYLLAGDTTVPPAYTVSINGKAVGASTVSANIYRLQRFTATVTSGTLTIGFTGAGTGTYKWLANGLIVYPASDDFFTYAAEIKKLEEDIYLGGNWNYIPNYTRYVFDETASLPTADTETEDRGFYLFSHNYLDIVYKNSHLQKNLSGVVELATAAAPKEYEPLTFTLTPLRNLESFKIKYTDFESSAASLLGYWPLDEGTGTTAGDISNSNPVHNGTLSMGNGCWMKENDQDYLYFNGADITGTYISINNNFNFTNKITVEAYIKLEGKEYPPSEWQKSNHVIVAQTGSFELIVTSGNRLALNLWTNQGFKQLTAGGYSLFGEWHKVAFTYDGANIILYIDGANRATTPFTGMLINNATTYIGTSRNAGCMFAKGIISDVKIYADVDWQKIDKSAIQLKEVKHYYHNHGGFKPARYMSFPKALEAYVPHNLYQNSNYSFWLTTKVPAGTQAGDYYSTVVLKALGSGNKRKVMRVKLTVHPFTLDPAEDYTFCMAYHLPRKSLDNGVTGWDTLPLELQDMKEHGMNTVNFRPITQNPWTDLGTQRPNASINVNGLADLFRCADSAGLTHPIPLSLEQYLPYDLTGNRITFNSSEWDNEVKDPLLQLQSICTSEGLPGFYFYLDEPVFDYRVENYLDAFDYLDDYGIENFCTVGVESHYGSLFRTSPLLLKVRCYNGSCESQLTQIRQDAATYGFDFWVYNGPTWSYIPAKSRFNIGYRTWWQGAKGHLVWDYAVFWGGGMPLNPLSNPDGVHAHEIIPDLSGPISTTTWEAIREGIDDIKYIRTLELLIAAHPGTTEAAAAQAYLDGLKSDIDAARQGVWCNPATGEPVTDLPLWSHSKYDEIRSDIVNHINILRSL